MQTAKLNSVPGCPRVEVLSITGEHARVKSDEAEPGSEYLTVKAADLSAVEGERAEVGDAAAEIDEKMRGRLDDLAALQKLAEVHDEDDLEEWSNDELLALDIGYGEAGPLDPDQVAEQAQERLDEWPLCVEATMQFEIVLGTGGPDDRLIVECTPCDPMEAEGRLGAPGETVYEVQRILYRYSWTGSAERVLYGDDLAAAEEYARRVVPELVE